MQAFFPLKTLHSNCNSGRDESTMSMDDCYRDLFVGLDVRVPLLDGSERVYTNLDNAASTPALKSVERAVVNFLQYYSSIHRGTGFKSQLSTHAYEEARRRVLSFLGADP